MKKIFLGIALVAVLLSCKEETKEKVKEASKAHRESLCSCRYRLTPTSD